MTTSEIILILTSFIGGMVLGLLFFYGLWYTVRKTMIIKNPAIWVLCSFFIRTGITLTGFYYISQGSLQRLLICLLGFISARYIVKHFTIPNENEQNSLIKENRL
jgi:F1F0 ATPase subunit 2